VLCCHEEIAVATATGYAHATGKPMVAATHSMVGLQHASMSIYNAWCSRTPLIVIGGTGPVAAHNRRNWIDWVHTALVQGNQVRDYVKWDDQPGSVEDFAESFMRAYRIAMTEPRGPVYLCYDVDLQEQAIALPLMLPNISRYQPPSPIAADSDALSQAAEMLCAAEWPVIIADAVGRHHEALRPLAELAELLGAPVISVGGYNLPSNHPLNVSAMRPVVLGEADVVLALDVADLAGALGNGVGPYYDPAQHIKPGTRVITINVWDLMQHSWAADVERLQAVDLPISGATRTALPALIDLCRSRLARGGSGSGRRIDERRDKIAEMRIAITERRESAMKRNWNSRPISGDRLFGELWQLVKDMPWTLVNGGPAGRGGWEITMPEQTVAQGGASGAGVGNGGASAAGAALALKDSGRFLISIQGDGDLLYTPSTLYTVANQKLPLLTIVNNNRSYGNDEGHQEHMARTRGRPVENKGIGIFIENPEPNFASIAAGFDIEGFGPVTEPDALKGVLTKAVEIVARERRPVVVDVVTERPQRW
jgi:thiamine pyrophosphate-dependent acetolactate synthase large subunit-like protein